MSFTEQIVEYIKSKHYLDRFVFHQESLNTTTTADGVDGKILAKLEELSRFEKRPFGYTVAFPLDVERKKKKEDRVVSDLHDAFLLAAIHNMTWVEVWAKDIIQYNLNFDDESDDKETFLNSRIYNLAQVASSPVYVPWINRTFKADLRRGGTCLVWYDRTGCDSPDEWHNGTSALDITDKPDLVMAGAGGYLKDGTNIRLKLKNQATANLVSTENNDIKKGIRIRIYCSKTQYAHATKTEISSAKGLYYRDSFGVWHEIIKAPTVFKLGQDVQMKIMSLSPEIEIRGINTIPTDCNYVTVAAALEDDSGGARDEVRTDNNYVVIERSNFQSMDILEAAYNSQQPKSAH